MMRYQEDANKIEQEAYLEDAAEREEDDEDSVAEASYEMSKEEEKDYFKDAKDFHGNKPTNPCTWIELSISMVPLF